MIERSELHPALVVGPSPIAGQGLFASEAIHEGDVCARMGGREIDDAGLIELASSGEPYSAFACGEGRHVAQADDDPLRFGNHSCDPNLVLVDATTLVARRDIAVGEEATNDYATMTVSPDWRMECNCGAPNCRGVITGDDWRKPELQRQYKGHWSPFIARRIRASH